MRRLRLLILIVALVVSLAAYYYYAGMSVRVETVQLRSRLTGRTLPYSVVLPPGYGLITSRRTRYPVLYLLHGWGAHHSSWLSETSLAQYASEYRLIIITPEGGDGWYTDSATVADDRFETYILEELIPEVDARFRTIGERGGRAVAGYSMGGYGALKFGLKHPEVFALAASTSGALDATERTDEASIMRTFGEAASPVREANDLHRIARDFPDARRSALPYFYVDCGMDDPWVETNSRLSDIFLERRIAHEYRRVPGGHVWPYWDTQVREILRLAAERMSPR